MRRLTFAQAAACENAVTSWCRCRCGGTLHGAARVSNVADLPDTDPHSPQRDPDGPVQLTLDLVTRFPEARALLADLDRERAAAGGGAR
jgi:hypothetical protein